MDHGSLEPDCMKLHLALVPFALLLVCSLAFTTPAPPEAEPKGVLVAVGGGGTTPEIIERALTLAGGKSAPLLIVLEASSEPDPAETIKFWQDHGAANVQVLDVKDRVAALKSIEKAAFIWMGGGDQSRLIAALNEAKLVPAIVERFRAGAVVGGTSAGAAVLSKLMIIGGERADLKSVRAGGTETTDGLGLVTAAVLDQHFVKRQRFSRLLSCVLDHPETIGIGIDERTAAFISGHTIEAVGESSVLIIDARSAKCAPRTAGENHSAMGVNLHVLTRGDKFEFGSKRN